MYSVPCQQTPLKCSCIFTKVGGLVVNIDQLSDLQAACTVVPYRLCDTACQHQHCRPPSHHGSRDGVGKVPEPRRHDGVE